MRLGLAVAAALVSFGVCAQDNWIPLTSSKSGNGAVLKGSFESGKNKAGEEIAVVTGKNEDNSTSVITLEKWYVRVSDCRRQQGKLVTLTMDGTFKYESDFIFGAGSVGAAKAEFICAVMDLQNQQSSKGL